LGDDAEVDVRRPRVRAAHGRNIRLAVAAVEHSFAKPRSGVGGPRD
jgi:hypothetical protein